jgi:hypothetical protein
VFMLLVRMMENNQLSKGVCIKIRTIKNINSAIRRLEGPVELGDEQMNVIE